MLIQFRFPHIAAQVSPKHSSTPTTPAEGSQEVAPSTAMMASSGSDQAGKEEEAKAVVKIASDVDGGLNAKGKARDVVEDEDWRGPEGEG